MEVKHLSEQLAGEVYAPDLLPATPEHQALADPDASRGEFLRVITNKAIENAHADHEADRQQEVYRLFRNPDTYEVAVESDVTLEDYKQKMHPDDWTFITNQARQQQGKKWAFINPTMEGGGVAMMRPPLIHMLRLLGVDARWYVMAPIEDTSKGNPFLFTKQMHNVSQRMSDERITEEGKALHWYWADQENGPVLERQIVDFDLVVPDDPQPAPLIARLKKVSPDAKFIWRNHIDTSRTLMSDPATPQGEIASYLLDECGVRDVDAILAHPVEEFIHPGMEDKTYFGPATFDHFDNLNRHLSEAEIEAGIKFINDEITAKNERLMASCHSIYDLEPLLSLDPAKKRLTLIARFDPSKGMDKAIEMGVLTRQEMRAAGVPETELPEVVIVGNGSVDDPDGTWMYEEMLRLRREKYSDEMDSIVIMRLKHNYDAMNALMSRSTILMQTSDAEGMETRISDAIKHGRPMVIRRRGGMPTQVVDGESGLILDDSEPNYGLGRGAAWMADLLMNDDKYAAMVETTKKQAKELNLREFTTPANVARFLRIANRLHDPSKPKADKIWKMSELTVAQKAALEQTDSLAA
jgi:glycosyltransferase involved in cell wall biosynthesis